MKRQLVIGLGLALLAIQTGYARDLRPDEPHAPGLVQVDAYTLRSGESLLSGYPPTNPDGTVNVVVEIPTGSNAKWEVVKPSGELRWEFKQGKPRVVRYLGYPGNYGMVPRTLLSKEQGGDGDPLDVIVLGPPLLRGSVVPTRIIGVLRLLDGGEQDDKLIAVIEGDPLGGVTSIQQLDERFPGVSTIVRIWFESYKGPGKLEAQGFDGPEAAMALLKSAAGAFEK